MTEVHPHPHQHGIILPIATLTRSKITNIAGGTQYKVLVVDQVYRYQEFGIGYDHWETHCRVRIFQPHPEATVVIVSDSGFNTGTSVTNFSQFLATLIINRFGLNPSLLIWIEQYRLCNQRISSVQFRSVQFLWRGKEAMQFCCQLLSQQQVEEMTGCFLLH